MDHIKNPPNSPSASDLVEGGVASAVSVDLQHPNDIAELTPWQVDFRQLDAGRLSTAITARASSTAFVLKIAMDGRVHQRGASPVGWTTFGIPKQGTVDVWQGQCVAGSAFLSFGDGNGFDGITTASFVGNVVSFDNRRLEDFAQACGFDLPDSDAAARPLVSEDGPVRSNRLQHLMSGLLGQSDLPWTEVVEETLIIEALTILTDSGVYRDTSRARTRNRALDRAIDLMLNNLSEPVSIEEICRQSGASWRTLERAFNERFGQGPKSYYTRMRLNGVREKLLKGSPKDRIIDTANRYGFWHLGQFARDYRQFFGELPSQTRNDTA